MPNLGTIGTNFIKMRQFLTTVIFAFLPVFAFGSCAQEAGDKGIKAEKVEETWLVPDSASYSKLGKKLTSILFTPTKVQCYHLVYNDSITCNDVQVERNIARGSLIATLDKSQIALLQFALFKPAESYQQDSVTVRAPYNPLLEFVFTKKKEEAHVIVSTNDMTWTVIYDDKRQFNYNFANKETLLRFFALLNNKK